MAMRAKPIRHDVSLLTPGDLHLFNEGTHYRAYRVLGSHVLTDRGETGTHFAVWAPNAESVSVMGDFNGWSRDAHPLRRTGESGIWEGCVPGIRQTSIYKYAVRSRHDGRTAEKADPYAIHAENPPKTGSIVWDLVYEGGDAEGMRTRAERNSLRAPMAIYEVHLGSWMRAIEDGNRRMSYPEIAPKLAEYCERMGFTHVELLPVMEHPFYASWGYQVTGHFAPTSRYGTPQDLMDLVDHLHQKGIGVILDWVPSHFPTDGHGLSYFDGTHLYEHEDPRQGFHEDWKSLMFNYGRHEVRSFLMSSAFYWLGGFHVDGPGGGAVAPQRMRRPRDPRAHPLPAPLQRGRVPRAPGRADDRRGVDGLAGGFASPLRGRPRLRAQVGHGLDARHAAVHGAGPHPPQVAPQQDHLPDALRLPRELRAAALPRRGRPRQGVAAWQDGGRGGGAQRAEWTPASSLEWQLLEHESHAGVQRWVADLNRLYRAEPALHELDCDPAGFEWVGCTAAEQSLVSFLRRARSTAELILVVCNFTPVPRHDYFVGVPRGGLWRGGLNSDGREDWGRGYRNLG